jgi:WD40 repeat protein
VNLLSIPDAPFVGLRPFRTGESLLFFGRRQQTVELLDRLHGVRFVSVIGSSGSGKSSLVRAGLIPKLEAGFLVEDRDRWFSATITPGEAPLANLAAAILAAVSKSNDPAAVSSFVKQIRDCGAQATLEALRPALDNSDANFLLVIDQFEELFRFGLRTAHPERRDEATDFVSILLALTEQRNVPVYVVITMRSDFLGDCDAFYGLPEAMNRSQYLVPRLTRLQRREAIEGPVNLYRQTITAQLLDGVLNDTGDESDQLPIMQHALLRTWEKWQQNGHGPLELVHYQSIGTIQEALFRDADDALKGLSDQDLLLTRQIFQALTDTDAANRRIRRPARLSELQAVTGASPEKLMEIIDRFRGHGRSFLVVSEDRIHNDALVDICHESLIRQWKQLRDWVDEEAQVREQYLYLIGRARRAVSSQDVLTGTDLDTALKLQERRLKPQWGIRYDPSPDTFSVVSNYIQKSENFRRSQRKRQKWNWILKGAAVVLLLVLAYGLREHYREQAERTADAIKLEQARTRARNEVIEQRLKFEHELGQKAIDNEKQAEKNADLAKQEADRANAFRSVATARQLASQAYGLKDRDSQIELSTLLALESLKRNPLSEGIQAVRAPMALLQKPLWTIPGSHLASSQQDPDESGAAPSYPQLQFSPDGQYVALVSHSGKLRVHSAVDGTEVPIPPIPGDRPVDSLVWAGPQLYALVGSDEEERVLPFSIFAVPLRGNETTKILEDKCLGTCVFTPDGTYLVKMAEDGSGQLYPLRGGTSVSLPPGDRLVAITPQGSGSGSGFVFREAEEGRLSVFDFEGKQLGEIQGNSSQPMLDVGGNSGYWAFAGRNRVVRLYRAGKSAATAEMVLPLDPTVLALSPNGQLLAVGDAEGGVRIVYWAAQARRAAWSHSSPLVALAFSPDAQYVASLDASGELRVVPLVSPTSPPAVVGPHSSTMLDANPVKINWSGRPNPIASFDPSERFLLLQSPMMDQFFDAATGAELPLGSKKDAYVAMSPDGRFAAFSSGREVRITDLTTGSETSRKLSGQLLALGPGARYLVLFQRGATNRAGQTNGRVSLVTSETGLERHSWEFNWPGAKAAFNRDGRFLVVRGSGRPRAPDQPIPNYLFVDLISLLRRSLASPDGNGLTASQFSSNGHLLAVVVRDVIRVFELPSLKLRSQITTDFQPTTLAFSRSSRYLAAASGSVAPRILQLPTGTEVSRVGLGDKDRLLAFHFSPDERSLVLVTVLPSSAQMPVMVLQRQHLFGPELLREGCSRVSRSLTPQEWKTYLPDYSYQPACPSLDIRAQLGTKLK